jgi:hypothetical protein
MTRRRFPVTLSRNDGRADENFRRWTVYLTGEPAFDIEASAVPGYPPRISLVEHMRDGSQRLVHQLRGNRRRGAR